MNKIKKFISICLIGIMTISNVTPVLAEEDYSNVEIINAGQVENVQSNNDENNENNESNEGGSILDLPFLRGSYKTGKLVGEPNNGYASMDNGDIAFCIQEDRTFIDNDAKYTKEELDNGYDFTSVFNAIYKAKKSGFDEDKLYRIAQMAIWTKTNPGNSRIEDVKFLYGNEGLIVFNDMLDTDEEEFETSVWYYVPKDDKYQILVSGTAIAKSDIHVHTPGEAKRENVVDPWCLRAGSYDEVIYCSGCGEELSREKKNIDALEHDWGEWKVVKEPTTTEEGMKKHICNRCQAEETESIDKLKKISALKFSSDDNFTLKVESPVWRGTMEYSTDECATWNEWDGTELSGTATQPIYMRGVGNTKVSETSSSNSWNFTGKYCTGNIEYLLDYASVEEGEHPAMDSWCFANMFYNCSNLETAPELPAEVLSYACYYEMFFNCESLKEAPKLPATDLVGSCYKCMFYGCKSLKEAPKLPAKNIANSCYEYMFNDCDSLTAAPELPATKMDYYCYRYMFSNCDNLKEAPELPATKMAESCYSSMFSCCTSLEYGPELPSMELASSCYSGMFNGCKSLKEAPELPATKMVYECYEHMFADCDSLIVAPELPATTLATRCYQYMFYYSDNLTTAPSVLPATELAESCYGVMFAGCTSLVNIPDELPATTLAKNCYAGMFEYCAFKKMPNLPATKLAEYCYSNMFGGCNNLTDIQEELPATQLEKSCYAFMFSECGSLKKMPKLPATSMEGSCYACMFSKCTSLTQLEELPATSLAAYCYSRMFENCTSLNDTPKLSSSVAEYCYYNMFAGCTSLKEPPLLPATYTQKGCFQGMFKDCTSLEALPAIQAKNLAIDSCTDMLSGCTLIKLSEVRTEEYYYEYKIPGIGKANDSGMALSNMIVGTSGPFTGNLKTDSYGDECYAPEANRYYYTSNRIIGEIEPSLYPWVCWGSEKGSLFEAKSDNETFVCNKVNGKIAYFALIHRNSDAGDGYTPVLISPDKDAVTFTWGNSTNTSIGTIKDVNDITWYYSVGSEQLCCNRPMLSEKCLLGDTLYGYNETEKAAKDLLARVYSQDYLEDYAIYNKDNRCNMNIEKQAIIKNGEIALKRAVGMFLFYNLTRFDGDNASPECKAAYDRLSDEATDIMNKAIEAQSRSMNKGDLWCTNVTMVNTTTSQAHVRVNYIRYDPYTYANAFYPTMVYSNNGFKGYSLRYTVAGKSGSGSVLVKADSISTDMNYNSVNYYGNAGLFMIPITDTDFYTAYAATLGVKEM